MRKNKKDWLKIKKYPHIGLPPAKSELKKWIKSYVTDPIKISKHSFLPFIHKTKTERRFRKEYCENTGELIFEIVKGKKHVRKKKLKPRELYYTSHIDSIIYSYYAEQLQEKYEVLLKKNNLSNYVTAYRSIPVNQENIDGPNKCSIHFAKEVFDNIKESQNDEFIVLAIDISGFFDNLNHKILRDKLSFLLSGNSKIKLPDDYFNLFKSLTRFTYVDLIDLFEMFKEKIIVKPSKSASEKYQRLSIKKIKYVKEKKSIAFCSKEEYFKERSKLLHQSKYFKNSKGEKNLKKFGIPQGSPLSCVLANLYMYEFDKNIGKYVDTNNGFYRRYSDDIIIVLPSLVYQKYLDEIKKEIVELKLEIKESKTQIFKFWKDENEVLQCAQQFKKSLNTNKNLKYLGFEFDGTSIKIKSSSLSNFHRKMKRAILRGSFYASNPFSTTAGELFKQRILKKFSYKGAERKVKWGFNKETERYEPTTLYDWGNFLTYSKKAAKIMESKVILSQTKKSWNQLNKLIKKSEKRLITLDDSSISTPSS